MGLTYQIAESKIHILHDWYRHFGYSAAEADGFCGMIFSHDIKSDPDGRLFPGWEIEYSAPAFKIKKKAEKNKVYANWMKGGWNRVGTWENADEPEPEKETFSSVLPSGGWTCADGMSADYLRYLTECGRPFVAEWLDPQDALYGLRTENGINLDKAPFLLEACADENYLYICSEVKAAPSPAMHHVFAVDVSGSMSSRWALVQLSMAALFKAIPEGADVSVIAFAEKCQVVGTQIKAGDTEGFMKALRSLPAEGGFGRQLPVLQLAFGMLTGKENNGIVTLFTDEAQRSGFAGQRICNDYLREQAVFGNRLHIVCYGTDSWRSDELRDMAEAGGRLRMVLSPDDIQYLVNEHWEVSADILYDFQIYDKKREWRLFGGNTELCGRLRYLPVSPGCSAAALVVNDGVYFPGDMLELSVKWKGMDGKEKCEDISVPVGSISGSIAGAVKKSQMMQQKKEKNNYGGFNAVSTDTAGIKADS